MTNAALTEYVNWLRKKAPVEKDEGFPLAVKTPDWFKPHQAAATDWAVRKGRCALFAQFGLGKTNVQMQFARNVHTYTRGPFLFIVPLGVRHEFTQHDKLNPNTPMGMDIRYCRTDEEVMEALEETPYIITNYERVRDGDLDAGQFEGISLDEASCLRSYGTKTTQTFTSMCSIVPYKLVATATPAPNAKNEVDYLELINYANFLGICDRGQLMTRFFGRDSKKAGKLTLYSHEQDRFWLWVASWALFISKPSDLGFSDIGYVLPEMQVHWHKVDTDLSRAWEETDKRGQIKLLPEMGGDIKTSSKERRATLAQRIEKAVDVITADDPDKHWLIWHYLEDERHLIKKLIPDCVSVYGSQNLEEREDAIIGFSNGDYRMLSTKPESAGSGCNFQHHCSDAIFISPTDKFNDFIQAVHRIYRFMQNKPVNIHIIYADTQDGTVQIMKQKWAQHDRLTAQMSALVRKYGLSHEALEMKLVRSLNQGLESIKVEGDRFTLINNDCVAETMLMADNSIDQIVTSIPFGDHYEYSPSYNDFGHNMGDEPFFEQMDFLIPHLYRILKPGRVACIHVKDRITYGKMTGDAMYGVNPFSDKTVAAFLKHGWHFNGRITIDTDVVRENAQTYRLGWSENAKDSTKMGVGSSEYVLLFRKWHPSMSPNSNANGPEPVTKQKEGDGAYTRGKWQIQACGPWRSSGDELLSPAQIESMTDSALHHFWKQHTLKNGYNYHEHVKLTEMVDTAGKLPASSMLFPPFSNNPDVWTDILRIRTLNTELSRKTTENHICPLQLDVIERLVERFSNENDTILDPFNGVGSTVYQSIKMNRKGVGIELNPAYFDHAVGYCEKAEEHLTAPTLFDLIEFQVA